MFEGIIISKTMRYILVLLYINPGKEYYLREIARRIKQQPNLVKINIKRLEGADFVKSKKMGNCIYYSVNKKNPVHREMQSIVSKVYVVDRRVYGGLKDK
jgi:predicted transcriptional regulator